MPPPVFLIPEQVLPVSPLPQRLFAAHIPRALRSHRREALDLPPSLGKIVVAFGQPPNAVQMIRQDYDGFNREGPYPHHPPESLPQPGYRVFIAQPWTALMRDHCKEITSSGLKGAPVFAHLLQVIVTACDLRQFLAGWIKAKGHIHRICVGGYARTRFIHPTILSVRLHIQRVDDQLRAQFQQIPVFTVCADTNVSFLRLIVNHIR